MASSVSFASRGSRQRERETVSDAHGRERLAGDCDASQSTLMLRAPCLRTTSYSRRGVGAVGSAHRRKKPGPNLPAMLNESLASRWASLRSRPSPPGGASASLDHAHLPAIGTPPPGRTCQVLGRGACGEGFLYVVRYKLVSQEQPHLLQIPDLSARFLDT